MIPIGRIKTRGLGEVPAKLRCDLDSRQGQTGQQKKLGLVPAYVLAVSLFAYTWRNSWGFPKV